MKLQFSNLPKENSQYKNEELTLLLPRKRKVL